MVQVYFLIGRVFNFRNQLNKLILSPECLWTPGQDLHPFEIVLVGSRFVVSIALEIYHIEVFFADEVLSWCFEGAVAACQLLWLSLCHYVAVLAPFHILLDDLQILHSRLLRWYDRVGIVYLILSPLLDWLLAAFGCLRQVICVIRNASVGAAELFQHRLFYFLIGKRVHRLLRCVMIRLVQVVLWRIVYMSTRLAERIAVQKVFHVQRVIVFIWCSLLLIVELNTQMVIVQRLFRPSPFLRTAANVYGNDIVDGRVEFQLCWWRCYFFLAFDGVHSSLDLVRWLVWGSAMLNNLYLLLVRVPSCEDFGYGAL